MDLKDALDVEYKQALRGGEKLKVSTLRLLKAALQNKEIETGKELTEGEAYRVIQTLLKQRQESIDAYKKAKRQDLADQETQEAEILKAFLPRPLSDNELESMIRGLLEEHGVSSFKEAQPLIRVIMERAEGRVDGKRVQEALRRAFPS